MVGSRSIKQAWIGVASLLACFLYALKHVGLKSFLYVLVTF
jgi:hypothetical protein